MATNRVVALFCPHSTGHMNPMLGLASSLVEFGWEVHFYVERGAREQVEAHGCKWRRMGGEEFSIEGAAHETITEKLSLAVTKEMNILPFRVVPATLSVLPFLLQSVAELQPRFIVHDGCAPWGSIVAELLRVPHASLMTALPSAMADRDGNSKQYPAQSLAILDATAEALKKEYGVDFNHNHSYEMHAPYTIITSSRTWHKGHGEFPADQFHYWGPLVSERMGTTNVEGSDAVQRLLSDDSLGSVSRPLIFCSLGTVTTGSAFALFGAAVQDYYQKLCRAAALLPQVTFIFAVGKKADLVEEEGADAVRRVVELFGERVPENVVVARSVDQPKVLRRANAFLTHCGQNSACEAVLAAVPVITAPFFGDQILNALRFEELGCGFSQSFHGDLKSVKGWSWSPDLTLISPECLAAAMSRLLEEPRFREAAVALRAKQEAEIGLPMADKLADLVANMDAQAKRSTGSSHSIQSCGGA